MPTPTEIYVWAPHAQVRLPGIDKGKIVFFYRRLYRSCSDDIMSPRMGLCARAVMRRSQPRCIFGPGLVRRRGPVRWVSAVPGQKPGSDQYVYFTLEV